MPCQAATTASASRQVSRRVPADEDEDNDQGVWGLERPGFRYPQHQQQHHQQKSKARPSTSRTRDIRAASVDSAFSVHRELYDEVDEEDEEQEQVYTRRESVAAGMLQHASNEHPPVPSLSTFGRAAPTETGRGGTIIHKKTTISTTTVPQKRTRAYSDTDTARGSRKQTVLGGTSSKKVSRGSGKEHARDRRKSDTGVQFKKPLTGLGLGAMNEDSQITVDMNKEEEMDLDESEEEGEKRDAGTADGATSSQEYEPIGLQDLARIERNTIHKPIIIEHTLSEQAEPFINELEDAYANQWQDVLSDKDSELYATANALGEIVLVDSIKVAEDVADCGERVLNINKKISAALNKDTHQGVEHMSALVAKQKALVEKLNENYARCKARDEKIFKDMQKIRDKTSAAMDEANAIYVASADDIEGKIDKLVNEKNLQSQFNSYLLKSTTARTGGATAGGGKKRVAK